MVLNKIKTDKTKWRFNGDTIERLQELLLNNCF